VQRFSGDQPGSQAAGAVSGCGCLSDAVWLRAGAIATLRGTEKIELLRQITSERSALVAAMRRRLVRAANQETVYRLISLFGRAIWLPQRYSLLLQSADAER
jgi:hypothetical protein